MESTFRGDAELKYSLGNIYAMHSWGFRATSPPHKGEYHPSVHIATPTPASQHYLVIC